MRKFRFFLILISLSFFMGGVSFAKLDPTFRKEFPDFIKNVCASSLEYDLKEINSKKSFRKYEKEVRDHKQDYDNAINCLYNQAIEGRITTTNAAIQKIFGTKKISHNDFSFEEFKKKEKYCKEGFFEEVLQKQKSLKANSKYWETSESVCEPEYFPREDEYKYSSCQVTEMLLAELCGYQHYLEAKMLDDHVGLTGGRNLRYIDDVSDDLNIALEHEQERSRKALKNALLFYAEFEHNYQRHAWLVAINEGLEGVAKRIAFFRDKIYSTFPTKFIDAATK